MKIDLSAYPAKQRSSVIRFTILHLVPDHARDLARVTADTFEISRQTAHKHIRKLIDSGLVQATGNTRARSYALRPIVDALENFHVSQDLEEDQIWRSFALPHLSEMSPNVRDLCQYGFTEMVNNVIDHSGSSDLSVRLLVDGLNISMSVIDSGIGIFTKIQNEFGLEDPRHALLELAKGKLTTDPDRHTGEGVYFSSRMFDVFSILSGDLYFQKTSTRDDQWLVETEDRESDPGTWIRMEVSRWSQRHLKAVFDDGAAEEEDYRFSRTHVPVNLARYGQERLVSRSQAKRVLARFDRFSEVMLDFGGIERIGQAFADEIFRVFARANPSVQVIPINTNAEVEAMILRVAPPEPSPT